MARIRPSTSRSSSALDEVGLVQYDHVREGDLVLGFRRILEARAQPFGIGDRDHGIEPRRVLHLLIDEEGLRHGGRIGEPGGFDDDGVELALPLHQAFHDADEVAPHRAADAAIVHLEHFLVGPDHEIVVDADLAELVDDDGVSLAVLLGEDAVQQRRLAGAQVAREYRDGNLVHGSSPEGRPCRHLARVLYCSSQGRIKEAAARAGVRTSEPFRGSCAVPP